MRLRLRKVARKARRYLRKVRREGGSGQQVVMLHPYRAIYFAIPKVANSSLKAAFVELMDPVNIPDLEWKPGLFNNPKYARIMREKGILVGLREVAEYSHYWKFAFVRNPWDRLVSCFTNKIRGPDFDHPSYVNGVERSLRKYGDTFWANMPFEAFVEAIAGIRDSESDKHFRSQYTFIADEEGDLLVDFVGRFERLDQDFRLVCRRLGVGSVGLPHLLKSERAHYSAYYTPALVERVRERYARDVELFGYEFERGGPARVAGGTP